MGEATDPKPPLYDGLSEAYTRDMNAIRGRALSTIMRYVDFDPGDIEGYLNDVNRDDVHHFFRDYPILAPYFIQAVDLQTHLFLYDDLFSADETQEKVYDAITQPKGEMKIRFDALMSEGGEKERNVFNGDGIASIRAVALWYQAFHKKVSFEDVFRKIIYSTLAHVYESARLPIPEELRFTLTRETQEASEERLRLADVMADVAKDFVLDFKEDEDKESGTHPKFARRGASEFMNTAVQESRERHAERIAAMIPELQKLAEDISLVERVIIGIPPQPMDEVLTRLRTERGS
ncbi:hypothetical protein HY627_00105 [Candidatus Uhrbacteria bacterium]|nr:hypothetical protein [Candidatus Uhrbacteria bacterium]